MENSCVVSRVMVMKWFSVLRRVTWRAAVRMLLPWKWRPPVEGEAGLTPGSR